MLVGAHLNAGLLGIVGLRCNSADGFFIGV